MFNFKVNNIFIYIVMLSLATWEIMWGNNTNTLGMILIILTVYLMITCVIMSINSIKFNIKLFLIILMVLNLVLIMVFLVKNILTFYILFESTLVPVFIIVLLWGSRLERLRAAYYLLFFTLSSSLLMLIAIIKMYIISGSLKVDYLNSINLPMNIQKWSFIGFALAMGVKIPLIPFHIWLPQAHVEAPLVGSILLAGILLKLGGYGFIYFILPIFPYGFYYFSPVLQTLSLIAIVYGGLTTLRQSDMKRLIAYSSVAHMGFATYALFSEVSELGISSCFMIFIAHGLVSPALFIIVGIIYDRFGSRIIKYYKGISLIMPALNVITFIVVLGSIAFPISLNFIGELLIIITASSISIISAIIISIGAFIGLKYSFYFYERIFLGSFSTYLKNGRDINKIELVSLLMLIFPVIILGIIPCLIINKI